MFRFIYTETMLRMATAVFALLSILAAPAASAACMARCDLVSALPAAMCHKKAHAQMGPHVDHMEHVHPMSTSDQDSDRDMAVQPRGQHSHLIPLTCHSAVCTSVVPARPARAVLSVQRLAVPAYLLRIAACNSSPPVCWGDKPDGCRTTDNFPLAPHLPLRI